MDNLPDSFSYPQKTQAMWKEFAGLDFFWQYAQSCSRSSLCQGSCRTKHQPPSIQRQGRVTILWIRMWTLPRRQPFRQHQSDQDFLERFMPSLALFEQTSKVSWEDYFPLLRYQILSNPDLTAIYQVNQENGCAHQRCYQNSPVCGRNWSRRLRPNVTKSACQTPLDLYFGAGQRKLLARSHSCPWLYRKRQTTSQVSERAGPSSQPNWGKNLGML